MRENLARPVERTTRAGVWENATTANNRRLRSGEKSEALLSGGVRRRLANQEMWQRADIDWPAKRKKKASLASERHLSTCFFTAPRIIGLAFV
jgi:hypothetical protein